MRKSCYNLETQELLKHEKTHYITKLANVDYEINANAPNWDNFINQLFENSDVARYLQVVMGYALSVYSVEQSLYMLIGDGANGKSTFIETINLLLGSYLGL